MLKMLGGILLVGASSAFGVYLYLRLSARVRMLSGLENAFCMLSTEISFLQTPLQQAAEKVSAMTNNDVFRSFASALANEMTPVDAMRFAISEAGGCLTTADEDVLLYASQILGNSEAQMQTDYIQSVTNRLSEQRGQAKHALQTTGRLYLSGGVLGGLLAALLLL